jgi:hypothetical protein
MGATIELDTKIMIQLSMPMLDSPQQIKATATRLPLDRREDLSPVCPLPTGDKVVGVTEFSLTIKSFGEMGLNAVYTWLNAPSTLLFSICLPRIARNEAIPNGSTCMNVAAAWNAVRLGDHQKYGKLAGGRQRLLGAQSRLTLFAKADFQSRDRTVYAIGPFR